MRRRLAVMFLVGLVVLNPLRAQETVTPAELDRLKARVGELYRQGQYAQALPLAQRVVAITKDRYGQEHPDTAGSLNTLAELYREKGDYAQAEPLVKRALAIREKALGSDHPDTAESLSNLAQLYHEKGDYGQAESLMKRALANRDKQLS